MNGQIMKGIIAVLAVALSACGGGGSGADGPATKAQAPTKTVLIESYGDSTMRGCTPQEGSPAVEFCLTAGYAEAPHNEPTTLQYLLQQQFGSTVTVTNMGIGGTTITDLLNGTNHVDQPWAQRMATSKANIVIIGDGINDAFVQGITPDQFAMQVDQAISIAKASGKTVLIETANPIGNNHNEVLAGLVAAQIATANKWGVTIIDEFGYLSSQPNWLSMLPDNIHPSDSGYEIKAQYAATIVAPIVKSMM
jgi:lysophospholipase L1-like esterase